MLNNDKALSVFEPLFKNIGVISILINLNFCFKYSIPRHFEEIRCMCRIMINFFKCLKHYFNKILKKNTNHALPLVETIFCGCVLMSNFWHA